MKIKNLFALATLTVALTGAAFGQSNPDINKVKARKGKVRQVQPAQNSGDHLTNQRRKPAAHDKYANQEVGYRQSKNEVAIETLEKSETQRSAAVFEPNNEPLWAKQKNRRKQLHAEKNQDIAVENDETHRTQPRAARTETVNSNESLRTKPRGKNLQSTVVGNSATSRMQGRRRGLKN